jgi:aromatic-L-amino-acid decarboxylase
VTSGGAESTFMAVLAALVRHAPDFVRGGARALPRDPVVYVSHEGHPTVAKAVRLAGLGDAAVRRVKVDDHRQIRLDSLREAIANDRQAGRAPVMIVATVGTTSTGAIDDLDAVANVAAREDAWLHADAAWGGMLAFSSSRGRVAALARADSVTFDPHKALFVPTGMGVFLRRVASNDHGLYEVETGYLPRARDGEPHASTPAWSRPFAGLALFTALATHGLPAFERVVDRQLALGERLRSALAGAGFTVVNEGPLPVACFVDAAVPGGDSARHLTALARAVLRSCGAWVSIARLPGGDRVLRAAIVGHRTTEADVDVLVDALVDARREG